MIYYLKRIPLVYEAIQWKGDEAELAEFMQGGYYENSRLDDRLVIEIKTSSRQNTVNEGDWILRDGLGRWWAVENDELLQLYARTPDAPEYLPNETPDKECCEIPTKGPSREEFSAETEEKIKELAAECASIGVGDAEHAIRTALSGYPAATFPDPRTDEEKNHEGVIRIGDHESLARSADELARVINEHAGSPCSDTPNLDKFCHMTDEFKSVTDEEAQTLLRLSRKLGKAAGEKIGNLTDEIAAGENVGSVCPDSTLEVRSDPGIYPPEQGQLLITKEAALKNISAALKELKNAFMLTEDDGK